MRPEQQGEKVDDAHTVLAVRIYEQALACKHIDHRAEEEVVVEGVEVKMNVDSSQEGAQGRESVHYR